MTRLSFHGKAQSQEIARIITILLVALVLVWLNSIAKAAIFTVNSSGDENDSFLGDGICDTANNPNTVPPIPPSGICTLRAALTQSTASLEQDVITFLGSRTIRPTSPLPRPGSVIIDGTGQSIVIESSLDVSGSTVRGLVIRGLALGFNNIIEGNFIGTDVTGTQSINDGAIGIHGSHNQIGGVDPRARNIIAGGININTPLNCRLPFCRPAEHNVIEGNFIGTDVTGTRSLNALSTGVFIFNSPNNVIGGTKGVTPGGPCTGACNVISGLSDGVTIFSTIDSPTSTKHGFGNIVQGNFIGTDVTGTQALGNRSDGVFINSAFDNRIGGLEPGAGNIIAFRRLAKIN